MCDLGAGQLPSSGAVNRAWRPDPRRGGCVASVGVVATAGREDVERFRRLDHAFRQGDFVALRDELTDDAGFPNVIAHPAIGACLTYAIYHAPLQLIAQLLEAGADPNWPSDDGFPPLIATLTCSQPAPGTTVRDDVHQILGLLLTAGADVDQRGVNDYTPLHLAAAQGDLATVDLLLAHGADADAMTRIDDYEKPVEIAAAAGHAAVVERLAPLTHGLDWEAAANAGDLAELKRLARRGENIDRKDRFGQTALMNAARHGRIEVVEWLIAHGADLDHTAKYHLSALMLAVINAHADVARLLVNAGADTSITGSGAPGFSARTAADLAKERGDDRLAEFIRLH